MSTARREAWIDRHVSETTAPVLLVNPDAVRTGLNNPVRFSTGIWYEIDYSADTYRQAIGGLHRIGQVRPAQEIAFDLVARKVSAALEVDGRDVRAALEAAVAGGGCPMGSNAALSLGKAVPGAAAGGVAGGKSGGCGHAGDRRTDRPLREEGPDDPCRSSAACSRVGARS